VWIVLKATNLDDAKGANALRMEEFIVRQNSSNRIKTNIMNKQELLFRSDKLQHGRLIYNLFLNPTIYASSIHNIFARKFVLVL
jgi:hypothetical protein